MESTLTENEITELESRLLSRVARMFWRFGFGVAGSIIVGAFIIGTFVANLNNKDSSHDKEIGNLDGRTKGVEAAVTALSQNNTSLTEIQKSQERRLSKIEDTYWVPKK